MPLTRRHFLTSAAVTASAATILPARPTFASDSSSPSPEPQAPSSASFSFIHLTDQHVTGRRHAPEGYAKCIAAINALAPDFVLMGGDMVFDGCYTELDDYQNQIRLFKDITRDLKSPWRPCLGNHDILGWHEREKVTAATDPGYGKKMLMDALEWREPYYSFDHKGWHFAVLDSCYPATRDGRVIQEPRIGPEQLEWLGYDLGAARDRPKIAVVHVAALCNVGQISGDPQKLAMDGAMVLWDTKELRQVLERHNVKLLLQGHSHRVEDTFWNGTWYVTGAAASAAWWAGNWTGSAPGFTIVKCEGDKVAWSHESYDWHPHLDQKDEVERKRIADYQRDLDNQQRLRNQERAGRKS